MSVAKLISQTTPIRLRVLIVTDSSSDAEQLAYQLASDNIKVDWQQAQTEADYRAALETGFDLVLSAWSLSQFSGLRALQLIRESGKETPLIVISARLNKDIRRAAMRSGAYNAIPMARLDRLGHSVRGALEQRRWRAERIQSEELLNLLSTALNAAANAIMITDPQGRIEWVNPAFSQLSGYSIDEAVGMNSRELVKSGRQDQAFYQDLWQSILDGKVWHGELINQRKDGTLYTEEMTITPLYGQDGRVTQFIAIKQDVSLRKQVEAALEERGREVRFLYEAGQQLSHTLDLESLYTTLYRFVSGVMDCDHMFISAYDSKTKLIRCVFAMHDGKSLDVNEFPQIPLEKKGHGTQSQVIRSGKPLLVKDYVAMTKTARTHHYINDEGKAVGSEEVPADADVTRSGLILPIILEKRVVGVIQVLSYRVNAYTPENLKMVEALATQFAVASNNATLYQRAQAEIAERKRVEEALKRSTQELQIAYDATLQGWSNALELRERETAGHSQRVVSRTLELAQSLGVDPAEFDHLQRGALLHDIGKMGIPDSILLKPDPLTAEEWDIMRQHPVLAYGLLSKIPYLLPALDIPYYHHERWDGSGYPKGLKGEEIPLAARIFAVVDVWDALSYNRPYHPAWPESAVLQYLQEQSGIQFDPRVVAAFIDLIKPPSS